MKRIVLITLMLFPIFFCKGQIFTGNAGILYVKNNSSAPSFSNFTSVSVGSINPAVICTLNTTGNNMIVVWIGGLSGSGTITDVYSNTWTALSSSSNGNCVYGQFFYCFPTTVGSTDIITYTGTSAGCASINGYNVISAVSFYCSATPVIDVNSGFTASAIGATTISPSAITPSLLNELYFFGASQGNGTGSYTLTYPTGYSSVGTPNGGSNKGGFLGWVIYSSVSSYSPTATAGGGNMYIWEGLFIK